MVLLLHMPIKINMVLNS